MNAYANRYPAQSRAGQDFVATKSRSIDEARAYEHEVFLALKEALPEARVSWSTGVPIGSHTCRELSVTSRTDMKVVLPGERRVAFEVVRVPENYS